MNERVPEALPSLLARWRSSLSESGDADQANVRATEDRLLSHVSHLMALGLDAEEAFLVALRRVSEDDAGTRTFARSYVEALAPAPAPADTAHERPVERAAGGGFLIMLGCAIAAGAAIKIPALFGHPLDDAGADVYLLNLSMFVLPFLLAFLAWTHRPPSRLLVAVAGALVAGGVFANAYPFAEGGSTQVLAAVHLPIVLWLAVGAARAGEKWSSVSGRMDFTRFTGESFITYTLIGLGGGVLSAMTVGVFRAIGVDAEPFVTAWLLPCGAMGAVLVAAWLVETQGDLVGGLAPMLARVFTPLFAVMLVVLLIGVIGSRGFGEVEREVLILFDLLLVVVLALLLYAISARDPHAAPGIFDRIQLVLVTCALAVDLFALASIAIRLGQFGASANKTAALGLNLILLVNLAWSARLQLGFLRSRSGFAELERWQMRYMPVYAIWAAIVVIAFPPLFGFA